MRRIKRWVKKNRAFVTALSVFVFCIGIILYASSMENRRLTVDAQSYRPLLDLIASVESKGNYNAHFGNAANSSVQFTHMTIGQVLTWQEQFVKQGQPSSAVGRYQIIDSTLNGLVRRLGVGLDQKFDEATQDRFAIALLERRGSVAYINGEMTREQFAANLAMEWAALPRMTGADPNASYYAGDGLNRSLVTTDQILQAIDPIRPE